MNSKQIIGAIMLNTGETISALAAKHNYTKQALYDVIKGRTKTPHLQALILSITGLPVSKLWPEPQAEEPSSSIIRDNSSPLKEDLR